MSKNHINSITPPPLNAPYSSHFVRTFHEWDFPSILQPHTPAPLAPQSRSPYRMLVISDRQYTLGKRIRKYQDSSKEPPPILLSSTMYYRSSVTLLFSNESQRLPLGADFHAWMLKIALRELSGTDVRFLQPGIEH